ncbi:MAG: hypothetical protein JHC31_08965, partial [Sulfurihydrogenibium sp.]|nr:hypothetical protein [Sulfurihydrogenibium sp.]
MRSKLRKAIFASAILSTAVLYSCGGGGSGESSSSNSSPSTPLPGPIASSVVKVLAQTVSGSNYQDYQVNICDLKPDGTISCGNNLNPTPKTANITFDYGIEYEFLNGNVLLKGSDIKAYYFDFATGTINKLTNGKDVAGNVLSNQLDFRIYNVASDANSNFEICASDDSSKGYVVITKSGKYVVNTGGDINKFYYKGNDSDFVVVTDNINHRTYRIDTDGNVSEIKDNGTSIEFQTLLAKIGDNILVKATNSAVYFLKDDGTVAKLVPSTSSNSVDARMIKVGSDFYIAVRDGNNLYYYKNNTALLKNPITIFGGSLTSYALDGSGNLYYYNLDNNNNIGVGAVTTNSQILPTKVVSSYDGLIGTSAGVIALDNYNKKVELLSITGNSIVSNPVYAGSNPDLFNAVSTCVDAKRNEPDGIYSIFNGEGTNQIMCIGNAVAYGSSVSSHNFSWIIYNNNGYNGKQIPITDSVYYVEFYNNKTIMYTGDLRSTKSTDYKIEICSAGSTTCTTIIGIRSFDVRKRYVKNNNYILAAAVQTNESSEKYDLYIADLLAGTSKQIFTDLSTYL